MNNDRPITVSELRKVLETGERIANMSANVFHAGILEAMLSALPKDCVHSFKSDLPSGKELCVKCGVEKPEAEKSTDKNLEDRVTKVLISLYEQGEYRIHSELHKKHDDKYCQIVAKDLISIIRCSKPDTIEISRKVAEEWFNDENEDTWDALSNEIKQALNR